ncbi:hypothetical protein [Actinomycetospora sp. CA-053990]|uniref:hypothetical protein n=1 Tax=Actinomycetospora sp. CA-053990 TaxID=3239891 RepID=UPI003D8CD53A
MPYVEGMTAQLLRAELEDDAWPDLLVVTEMPDKDVRTYPLVLITNANTSYEYDGEMARATVDFHVWSKVSRRQAAALGESVRLVLRAARRAQTRLEDDLGEVAGHLVGFDVNSSGFLPSGDTDAPWRFQLLASMAVRPNA